MRRFSVKQFCCLGFLAGLMIILGCGSSGDPIDESGYRYQITTASVEDRNAETNDIDIWQDCDNDYANGTDGEDEMTGSSVTLTFESNENQEDDVWVYVMRKEYTLLNWTEGDAGPPDTTPAIPTKIWDEDVFIPGEGGQSDPVEIDLLSTTDKEQYRNLLGKDNAGLQTRAEFQVKITAFLTYTPQDPETHLEINRSFTINVQNFMDDSCSDEEETP